MCVSTGQIISVGCFIFCSSIERNLNMSVTRIYWAPVGVVVAALILGACSDQASTPKVMQPLTVNGWGPQETRRGEAVNLQPDGESAIWIGVKGVAADPATKVMFGNQHTSSATVMSDVVTTAVPKAVINTTGDYPVVIEEPNGRRTSVGTFSVKP